MMYEMPSKHLEDLTRQIFFILFFYR